MDSNDCDQIMNIVNIRNVFFNLINANKNNFAMKKLKIMYLPVLIFFLNSCTSDSFSPINTPTTDFSFTRHILPLLNAYRCKSCHYNSFTPPDLTDANAYKSLTTGTTYVNISVPSSSVFYQSVSNPDFSPFQMPDGIKLTEAEQATILEWIKQGAKP